MATRTYAEAEKNLFYTNVILRTDEYRLDGIFVKNPIALRRLADRSG
jgi:hypothetical protein